MPRAARTAHDYRDPSSFRSKWRERCIVLPEEIVEGLFEWHGGQGSSVYALASTGMRDLVSLSMIDAALSDLEHIQKAPTHTHGTSKVDRKHLKNLIDELHTVRQYWQEHSAEEAGMEVDKYEYDGADYGLTAKDEDKISTRSS